MRNILLSSAKEKIRTLARFTLGLDVRFARSRDFDIWRYELFADRPGVVVISPVPELYCVVQQDSLTCHS